jgi:hypothetical protein
MMNEYATEKIRQLEDERLNHVLRAVVIDDASKAGRKPVVGRAVRFAGRTLKRVGAGLENWAEPPQSDGEVGELQRGTG